MELFRRLFMNQQENDILLNNFVKNTFYKSWKNENKFVNFSHSELILSAKCNLSCKYCYYNRYGDQLYPEEITNFQMIIFALTSVITLVGLRKIIKNKFFNKGTQSEEVEDEFTGKEAFATVGFGPSQTGKVEFKGTTWRAESSSEIKEGQKVVIIEKENFKLIVEPKN